MNQKNQENIQKKYLELSYFNEILKKFNQQISLLENQLVELQILDESLKDISLLKKKAETLISLGPGVYMKGDIKKTDTILINVGAGVVIEKTFEESHAFVKKQIDDLKSLILTLQEQVEASYTKAEMLQHELTVLIEEKG